MKKVKVGVVGVGHLGYHHARVFKSIDNAELVGVYDINEERAQEVAREWDCKAFKSYEEMLDGVDAVSCVVPTKDHYSVGKKALEAGKHLFLEKPMATTYEEGKELVDIARKNGLKFQIGHIERFNPAVLAVRDIIDKPKFIECHRLSLYNPRGTDVDVVLDLMIHDLDLIIYYLKKMPSKVDAVGVPVITDKIDIANARLEFPGGEIANVTASRVSAEKMRKIRLFQKDTYISIDYLKKHVEVFRKFDDEILPFFPPVGDEEPLMLELKEFVDAIIYNREPPVTGEEGLKALEVALAVKEGIWKRLKEVSLD